MIKARKKTGKRIQYAIGTASVLLVFVCYQNMTAAGKGPAVSQIGDYLQEKLAVQSWKNCMPSVFQPTEEEQKGKSMGDIMADKLNQMFPVAEYTKESENYTAQIESELSYEMAMAQEGMEETRMLEENQRAEKKQKEREKKAAAKREEEKKKEVRKEEGSKEEIQNAKEEKKEEASAPAAGAGTTAKAVEIPRQKLYDFDYLLHSFYQVDRTTTIDGTQLNPDILLGKSMKLTAGKEAPQILIYHTHSQEGYADSVPGDAATTVVGLGEYLTALLRDKYGFHVLHHTGEYDVIDRDNAYSYAGPGLEQVLAENPSVEVVIDLHRDGVGKDTRLVSEVNGKQTAKVMFFNGLSRTTQNGNLTNLPNPYIADNLAFSFQMKLAAEEYYPGFTRPVYLKGYRYNMHYRPKTLLVEVGAQTNTFQEAMNAMEPLADLLHKVLTQ